MAARFGRKPSGLRAILQETPGRLDSLLNGRMAVKQPEDDVRRVFFRQILRPQSLHRRNERGRLLRQSNRKSIRSPFVPARQCIDDWRRDHRQRSPSDDEHWQARNVRHAGETEPLPRDPAPRGS